MLGQQNSDDAGNNESGDAHCCRRAPAVDPNSGCGGGAEGRQNRQPERDSLPGVAPPHPDERGDRCEPAYEAEPCGESPSPSRRELRASGQSSRDKEDDCRDDQVRGARCREVSAGPRLEALNPAGCRSLTPPA